MSQTKLLTSTQAAQVLGKSPRTIQRMADAGELQIATKLPGPNGAYLFEEAEIIRAFEAQVEEPDEEEKPA
jgi:hypothetical protein